MATLVNTGRAPGFRLGRTARRSWLIVHIGCAVGWMGADVLLAILTLTARFTADAELAAAAYRSARLLIPIAVPVLAFGMLVTGIVLGAGSQWGLARYWWVLVKLAIGVVLTILVVVLLVPGALSIPGGLQGTADQVRELVGDASRDLMFPPLVSFTALGIALVLSVLKPWGRTRWARAAGRTGASDRP